MATGNKYDRQIRLWGAKGQKALSETHVLLVNPTACGTETLKNLVLPGIGKFTVVDVVSSVVTPQDSSSNFFLPVSCVGQSRSETASKYLAELNPDVQAGHFSIDDESGSDDGGWPTTKERWNDVLMRLASAGSSHSSGSKLLVIASDLPPPVLMPLAGACAFSSGGHPLLVVMSYGLIGLVRLQLPGSGVPILDPKPTNAPPDLRLVNPINGLVEMAATEQFQDLSKLDSQQHGHVPYPILLYKAMQQWKSQNDGRKLPKTFAEKQDFVALLKSMSRDLNNELNFQEAVTNAYLAYTEREVIFPIDEKMDVDDNDDNNNGSRAAGATSTTLRELFDALRTFMDRHNGRPPLNGSLPDMTSSTEWYVQLQRIYKAQADADVEEMKALLHGASSTITDESIASFCANVFAVSHIATRSLAAEYAGIVDPTANEDEQELVDDWKMSLMDPYEDGPIHTPIVWYLGIRACQTFYEQHGYYPGCNPDTTCTDSWKDDVPILLKVFIDDIVPRYSLTDQEVLTDTENIQKVCHELTRYSNAEIHNVASVVGGVASQEAVKIITGQYIPLNNTYIYNGIVSVGGVYKM